MFINYIKHQASSIKHQASSIKHQASSIGEILPIFKNGCFLF